MRKKFMAIRVTQSKKPGAEGYANSPPAVDFPARMPNCHTVADYVSFSARPKYSEILEALRNFGGLIVSGASPLASSFLLPHWFIGHFFPGVRRLSIGLLLAAWSNALGGRLI
jgi:hypothetical protein